ncbi:hypothetical protein Tco_0220472, partial [Tanacetum coccineum]
MDESDIPEAIHTATLEIVGKSKGISNIPITLVVKKKHKFLNEHKSEAFVKIREQAKAYLEMKGELTSGVNPFSSRHLLSQRSRLK